MPTELDYISATEDCPHPELWSARDAAASEHEVGDFLYGLVRVLKPAVVIETGCYLGDTSLRIAQALAGNDTGILYTCDLNPSYVEYATGRLHDLPAVVRHIGGKFLCDETGNVDLAFLDSGGDRMEEAKFLKLPKHGIVVLHDSRHKDYKGMAQVMGWQEIFIPTPRGLSVYGRIS